MKIGELARSAQCDVQTVRYYEREGLLPATRRTAANYRAYSRQHLERLQFIRRCRSLDMALEEIRTLLHFRDSPEENCGEVNRLLDEHLGHVAARLEELAKLEQSLRRLRRQCRKVQTAKDCGILSKLASEANAPEGSQARHLRGVHSRR